MDGKTNKQCVLLDSILPVAALNSNLFIVNGCLPVTTSSNVALHELAKWAICCSVPLRGTYWYLTVKKGIFSASASEGHLARR